MVNQLEVLKMIRHLSSGLPIDASPSMMRHLFDAISEICTEAIQKTLAAKQVAVQVTGDGIRLAPEIANLIPKEPKRAAVDEPHDPIMGGYSGPEKFKPAIRKILERHDTTFDSVVAYGWKNGVNDARVEIVQYMADKGLSHHRIGEYLLRSQPAIYAILAKSRKAAKLKDEDKVA